LRAAAAEAFEVISTQRKGYHMDIFSFTVLEDTLNELAAKEVLTEDNARQNECVTAIRACMELIALNPTSGTYTNKIRHALIELARVARQKGEFAIAARIKTVEGRLAMVLTEGDPRQQLSRLTQTAP
jgi:hypothetical protein